jgi:hypothetical protein
VGDYELQWARAFALTLGVEVPLYFWLLCRQGVRAHMALGAAIVANAISHPVFWFALPPFEPYAAFVAAGEAMVIIIEALVIMAWGVAFKPRLRAWSVIALVVFVNLMSMLVGLLL